MKKTWLFCYFLGLIALINHNLFAQPNFNYDKSVSVIGNPTNIVSKDFNSDGKLDFAYLNSDSAYIYIYTGSGTGTFGYFNKIKTADYPIYMEVLNVNGDALIDFVVLCSGKVNVFTGSGTGSFGLASQLSTNYSPYYFTSGFFNNDSFVDLAVLEIALSKIYVFTGLGNGNFNSSQTLTTLGTDVSQKIVNLDINNDNKSDLIYFSGYDVFIATGTGLGTFNNYKTINNPGINFPYIEDMNNNGVKDLVYSSSFGIQVATLTGGNDVFDFSPKGYTNKFAYFFTINDFDKDGIKEVANSDLYTFITLFNRVDNNAFSSINIFQGQYTMAGICSSDINGDSYPDLLSIVDQKNYVSLFINTSGKPQLKPLNYSVLNANMEVTFDGFSLSSITSVWFPGGFTGTPSNVTKSQVAFIIPCFTPNGRITFTGINTTIVSELITVNGVFTYNYLDRSQTICGGDFVNFVVNTAESNLTFRWNTSATTVGINASVTGVYVVTITGSCGKTILDFNLVVIPQTKIISQPQDIGVRLNESTEIILTVIGGNLSYNWNTSSTAPSLTTSILGQYMVTISGTCGTIVSNIITVIRTYPTLIVKAFDATITGAVLPIFSGTVSGLVSGDDVQAYYYLNTSTVNADNSYNIIPIIIGNDVSKYQITTIAGKLFIKLNTELEESIISQYLIKVYPNPADNILFVQSKFDGLLTIWNVLGTEVGQYNINSNKKYIELYDLSKGMYFYRFDSEFGIVKGKFYKK